MNRFVYKNSDTDQFCFKLYNQEYFSPNNCKYKKSYVKMKNIKNEVKINQRNIRQEYITLIYTYK